MIVEDGRIDVEVDKCIANTSKALGALWRAIFMNAFFFLLSGVWGGGGELRTTMKKANNGIVYHKVHWKRQTSTLNCPPIDFNTSSQIISGCSP